MKISELLEKLGELQGLHGDIDVVAFSMDDNGMATALGEPNPVFEKPYGFEESVIIL